MQMVFVGRPRATVAGVFLPTWVAWAKTPPLVPPVQTVHQQTVHPMPCGASAPISARAEVVSPDATSMRIAHRTCPFAMRRDSVAHQWMATTELDRRVVSSTATAAAPSAPATPDPVCAKILGTGLPACQAAPMLRNAPLIFPFAQMGFALTSRKVQDPPHKGQGLPHVKPMEIVWVHVRPGRLAAHAFRSKVASVLRPAKSPKIAQPMRPHGDRLADVAFAHLDRSTTQRLTAKQATQRAAKSVNSSSIWVGEW